LTAQYDVVEGGIKFDASSYIPEVHIQDQATNGLIVQQAVNKGDYVVVDREELVTNGTFDTDSDWNKTGWTISGGVATRATSSDYNAISQDILLENIEYILSFDVVSISGGNMRVVLPNAINYTQVVFNSIGKIIVKFTASLGNNTIQIARSTGTPFCVIDNISVRQVEEVLRAKEDVPSLTPLTDTRFENRDNMPISNQIGMFHTLDSNDNYIGITAEVLINDAYKVETPKAILVKNGFSEISEGLYSKGDKKYLFIGYWQTLNKSSYHPVFNMSGVGEVSNTAKNSFGKWGQYDSITSASGSFIYSREAVLGDSGSVFDTIGKNCRPDSKFYDIIYKDQFIDCREYSFKADSLVLEQMKKDKEFEGVEDCSQVYGTALVTVDGTSTYSGYPWGTNRWLHTTYVSGVNDALATSEFNSWVAYISSNSGRYYKCTYGNGDNVHINPLDGIGTPSDWTSGNNYDVIITNTIPHNSQGSHLHTDLIGNPENYDKAMKDRLAEGKGLFGVSPLLVSDEGVSQLPNADANQNFKLNKKILSIESSIRTDNSGATYTDETVSIQNTTDYIKNHLDTVYRGAVSNTFVSYTAQNNPLHQSNPLAVIDVKEKVIASNSHSLYKGAIVGNCIGKIQTGNGSNGLESKVLENVEVDENSNIQTTPKHSTLSLDNSDSTSSKWFDTLAEDDEGYLYRQTFINEMVYNISTTSYDGDNGEFNQLTNGAESDLNGNTTITKVLTQPLGIRA
ncbi:MAG: hypothetical protein ACPG9K_01160, partial [Poseidonibacter sp.]